MPDVTIHDIDRRLTQLETKMQQHMESDLRSRERTEQQFERIEQQLAPIHDFVTGLRARDRWIAAAVGVIIGLGGFIIGVLHYIGDCLRR